jgi:hypothetical protein
MKSKSSQKRPLLSPPLLLGLGMFCLLAARLTPSLPVTSATYWYVADLSRSVAYLTLAGYLLAVTPYDPLRTKCLVAAIFGWAAVDLVACAAWYAFGFGGYWFANIAQAMGVVIGATFYWFRSYRAPSASPEPGRIYCLRHRPRSPQDLILALAGLFGPYGGYAIYCRGLVYQFRRGVMTSSPFVPSLYVAYHCTEGTMASAEHSAQLDAMVGRRWQLFGSNCVTLLGRFWANDGRKNTSATGRANCNCQDEQRCG